jgi:hypothetical protein
MVRLRGFGKDCDEETLSADDRALCDWLHGRQK